MNGSIQLPDFEYQRVDVEGTPNRPTAAELPRRVAHAVLMGALVELVLEIVIEYELGRGQAAASCSGLLAPMIGAVTALFAITQATETSSVSSVVAPTALLGLRTATL